MRVVSNTGPLIHLLEADALYLLRLVSEVYIPKAVAIEMKHHLSFWNIPDWITLTALHDENFKKALNWQKAGLLDFGESEAIALTKQLKADWFLTDDAAARLLAKNWDLEVHGSLGIVLWTRAVGHIKYEDAKAILEKLYHSSLWISPRIYQQAIEALEEMAY